MRTQMIFGVLVLAAALGAPVKAAQDTPDPTEQREFAARVNVCGVCHANNGVPKSAQIPIIWGQQENYLLKQLHDFRSGDRRFEIIEWMTKTFGEPEPAPTSAKPAKQQWPAQARDAAPPS